MAGYDDFAKLLDEQAPATDPNVARAREKGSPPRFPVETTEDAARAARRQKGVLDAELQADEPHTRTEDFAREYGRALDRTRSTPDAPEPKKPAGDFEAGMEFFTALSGGKEVPAKGAAQQNYDPFSGNSNMPGDAIEQPESAPRAPRALEVDRRPMEERPARAVLGPGGKRTVMVKSGEDDDFNLTERQAPYLGDGGVFTNAPAGMVAASKNAAANLARQWQGDVAMQNRAMGTGSGDVVGYSASPTFARYQDAARQRTQIALDQATKAGEQMKQWADQTKREMELVTPRGMSTFQQAIWSTVQSAPPTLIGISVGILTKNPQLAMAIAGGGGSAFQTGSTYGEAMDKLQAQGYSQDDAHRKASFAATIDGILEGVGEALPLGLALKPGSQIMARLFETMVAEAGQEAATQAMQDFNAYLSYDPNITLQEAWENMKVAALAGAMGGAVYGAAGHAVAASQERALERARPGITDDQAKSIRDQVSALNGPGNVMEPLANTQMARGAVTTRSDVSAPTIGAAPAPVEQPSAGPAAAPVAPQPATPSAPAPAGAQEPPQEGQQPLTVEDMEKEAARRAEMTHRLDDGTLAEPYVSAEDGKPVAGFWRTEDGTVVEAPRGEPLQKQETNGVWDVDGTTYDVTVIGKGREKDTARLADGQEIPIQQLAELDDEARLALGMKIDEPAAGNKKKPATTPATPSEAPAAPAAKGGETEPPPPRGSAAPEGAAGAPPTGQASTPPGREAEQKAFVSAYTKQGVPEEGARMLHRRAQEAANKTGKAQVLWQAPNGPLAIQPEGQAPVFKDGEVVATIEPSEAVLAKKDERKAKASERMTKRADERRRINVETDTLVQAIIKMGGISKEYQLDISGDTKSNPRGRDRIPFVGTLFRAGGDSPDGLGRRLAQYGYLTDAEAEDPKIVSDRIREELNGTRQYYSQMSRTGERQAREEMERRRPGYQEDRNLVDDALEASDDAPLELDYPPEELAAAGLDVTGETLAIVDLMSQLPEAERERMAIRGESLSEKQLLEELTKIVREDNRGRETEAGSNSQRGEQRGAAPSERAGTEGAKGAESAGAATAARGGTESTAEERVRASDRSEAGDRLEQAAASYEVGQWTGKPIVGTIKWDVSPKKRGARILATGSVNGKVVVRVVRPEYNVVTLDIDGWTFGEGYRPNYNNVQRAQLVAERIIRPEPTRRVEEPGADYEIHPKKGYETAEQWVGRMRASHPNDWVEVANKTIAEMERTYGERATRYHELKGSVGEGARTMDLRDFNARITELRAAVHRVAMRAEQKTPEYKTARFAESGWDFQKTFPRPHADSRYAADAEEGGAPAIAAMHEAIGEQLFRDLARIAYYGEALQRGEIAGKKLTPKRREEIQQGLSYLARDGDGLVSEYEMAFGHEAGKAFFDPIRARAAEAGKSAQFALDMQTPPQAKAKAAPLDLQGEIDEKTTAAKLAKPTFTGDQIRAESASDPIRAAGEAYALISQGKLAQIKERKGFCYWLSGKAAMEGVGKLSIGVMNDGHGNRMWHGVVQLEDGAIYDPTLARVFSPGVFEKVQGFQSVVSMTGPEVMAFGRRTKHFPDPATLGMPAGESKFLSAEDEKAIAAAPPLELEPAPPGDKPKPPAVGPEEAAAAIRDRNEAILTPPEGTAPPLALKPQPTQQQGLFGPEVAPEMVRPAGKRAGSGNPSQLGLFDNVEDAAKQTDKKPTQAEQLSGDYKKGRFATKAGVIAIETPAGTERVDAHHIPPEWRTLMRDHYGEFERTVGFDKDRLDVFVKPGTTGEFAGPVYVVNQVRPDGNFDEHKVMYGYASPAEARAAYLANYPKGWKGLESMQTMTQSGFLAWSRDTSYRGPKGGILSFTEAIDRDLEAANAANTLSPAPGGTTPEQGGATAQRDLLLATAVPGTQASTLEKVVVEPVEHGSITLPHGEITTPVQAAQAFRHLETSPSEKMQMIGTDAAGRPIAYFEVFSGTLASVNAFPREVILLAAQTPGVTKVWLAHNHPSGEAQPSSADISVTKNFARGFGKDIGITLEGHLVIAAGEASMIDEKGTFHRFKIGKPPQSGIEVPIIERKVTRTDAGMKINSPSASRAMAKLLDLSPPGLMLLDAQRRLVGYWPMSVREMSVLRTGDLASGAARLFRQMGRNNVAAVVANLSKYKLSPAVQYAVENVGAALDVLGIEVIDALANDQNGNVTSFAERGHTLVNPDGFYALGAGAGTAPERVQAELKDDKLAKAMGGRLHVAASALELPEYAVADLKERGALADVRGYFDSMTGHVWLVSSNISPGEAQATLVHEMVGHVGLQQVLGPKFMDRMLEIYESRKGDIMGEANSGFLRPYAFDLRNRTHRATAAAEWIAHKAEAGEEQTLWQKVVAWIREGLRELGIVRHYSDNDILELLRRSRSSLEHGGLDTYNGEPADGPSPVDAFEPENITPGTLPEPTAKIEEAPAPSGKSEIQTKPGADFRRLNALLGAKLYGEPRDIAPVSVKEMVQNSFDAIKALIDKGQVRTGSIDIKVDWNERTITVSDNGSGMRPETLATTFLRIASTEKETTRSSGGLGIAKGLFLYGNKRIRVETIRDGKLAVLDTSGPELEAAAAGQGEAPTVKVSPAPGGLGHGTTVKVWIPADFIDTRSGEKVAIHLPDDPQYYKVLQNSPLFSNIHVGFNGKPMPNMGATFPANEYSVFARVQFHFGDATIYVTKKETPIENYTDNVHFLSNGLWQFSSGLVVNPFEIGGRRIPRRLYIDVHPKVEPEDSAYPFDLNRQRFTAAAGKDFDRVLIYATLAYRRELMAKSAANFGQIHYLDQGRPTEPQTLAPPFDPAEEAKLLRVLEGDTVEVREGKLFVNGRSIPAIKREDMERATLDLTKYRVDQNEIDEDKVMVHDNTRTANGESFTVVMRRELGPEFDHFMQGLGEQFIELRDAIVDAYPNKYLGLSNSAVGMSFDKTYHGVNISVPFRGVFVNPASFSRIEDLVVLGNEIFGTMVHELVHEAEKGHNADFVNELQRMYSDILSSSGLEAIRKKVISLVEQHDQVVSYITGAFSDANLSNAGQSLEGKGKTGSRGAAEGAPGRSEGPGGERVHGEAGLGAGSLERGAVSNVFSRGRQEPVGYYSLRSDGPRGTNEVYGVRDGRLLGYARRAYQGGIWDVFLANGANESLFARGQFRREQAANVTEVQRIFNRAGLELRIIKPRNIPIPERTIFDRDWVAPEADSWVRRSVIYFQNRLLLPELYEGAIERAVGAIPEEAKAHREARLAHPRAAGKIADFDHDYTDRIVQVMRRARLSMKEVGLYLYARHAAERNAAIEAKNPENAAGSGMPTYRAEQLLEMFQATDARWAELQQIGAVVDEINRFREQVLIDKGLAPREAVELLRKYAHYVPLKDLIEDEFAQSEVGGGYQVGQLMHTAFGRFTEAQAEFILPGLIGQAKGTISAGENAEVLRTFLRQVEFAPNPDVWDVRRVEYKPRIDPETGMVQWAPQPVRKDSRNIISVPVNGKRVFVKVKDDRLARAYNSSGLPLVDSLKLIGTVTRFYALMATAANPEFVMTNAMRDFQQAMLRLTGEHNPEMAARVAKDMLPALWGAFSGLRAEGQYRPGESALPLAENWHAWYRRYIEAGGHIAYRGLADTETQHKEFLTKLAERGIYPENASKIEQFRLRAHRAAKVSGAKFFSQLIVDANGAVENALRLAAFKNAVQMGFTEKDAAMLARSVTVDFNLRGEAGSRIGALYMFFNANMQGTALLWRSVSRNRYMQGLAFMLFLMGLASDWWNSHWAEEGPDGRNAYDNISAAVKERNWIIMAPDRQNAITIAMPFGFNVFPLIGSNLGAVLRGAKKPLDAAQSIFVAAVNAFSPFGQSPTSWLGTLQLLSPTITDPAVQAITNRNFMEQSIVPERPHNAPPQSDAATYFAGTPDVYVGAAQWLNEATGGNDVRSGQIDWSPNMLQHWVRSLFGSAGAFYARVVEAVHGAVADTPTEIEPRNIPFVRRFYYEPRDYELSRRFYENVRDAEVAHYEVRRAFEAGRPELGRALREEFQREREMFGEAEAVERQVSELRSQVSRIRRHPTMSDEQKKLAIEKLQEQSRGAMMRFNKRFEDRTAR